MAGRHEKHDLDAEYPQGDPGAIYCRHCGTGRQHRGAALVCPTCDPDPMVWNDQTRPEPLATP